MWHQKQTELRTIPQAIANQTVQRIYIFKIFFKNRNFKQILIIDVSKIFPFLLLFQDLRSILRRMSAIPTSYRHYFKRYYNLKTTTFFSPIFCNFSQNPGSERVNKKRKNYKTCPTLKYHVK